MHQSSGVGYAEELIELPDMPAYADIDNMPYNSQKTFRHSKAPADFRVLLALVLANKKICFYLTTLSSSNVFTPFL
jgi:hypothetical protein